MSSAPASSAASMRSSSVAARLVEDDHALALELPRHRAGLGERAAVAGEDVLDLGAGAVAVVGERSTNTATPFGRVALVGDVLVGDALELAGAALDRALDVVHRHRRVARLLHHRAQRRVAPRCRRRRSRAATSIWRVSRANSLPRAGVGRALLVLDRMPFGMSAHAATHLVCRNRWCTRRSPESSGWKLRPRRALAAEHRVRRRARRAPRRRRRPLDDRRPDEHARERSAGEPVDVERRLERVALAAVAVAAHRDVETPNGLLVGAAVDAPRGASRMSPAQVPSTGSPSRQRSASGARSPTMSSSLSSWSTRRPGRTSASSAGEVLGRADLDRVDAERVEHLTMLAERPLQRQDADLHLEASGCDRHYQPRSASLTSSVVDLLAPHRVAEAARDLGDDRGVGVVRGGLDDRLGPRRRVVALEDARCRRTPPARRAASRATRRPAWRCRRRRTAARAARRARRPPARDRPAPAAPWPSRRARSSSATRELRMSPRIERRWRTASTMLPVPASPFERIMRAPSPMRRSASPRLVAPHTNGDGERPLVDVVRLVGRGEHLGLVDVVDAERLEHLRLGEVADAALRHDRDRDRGLDALDHRRVAHAGDAAVAADVGGNPLERHHRDRAGVLGDLGLLGVTTSMITPPRSISASPRLTRAVPGCPRLCHQTSLPAHSLAFRGYVVVVTGRLDVDGVPTGRSSTQVRPGCRRMGSPARRRSAPAARSGRIHGPCAPAVGEDPDVTLADGLPSAPAVRGELHHHVRRCDLRAAHDDMRLALVRAPPGPAAPSHAYTGS